MMLKLLSRMVQVLQDPALAIRQKNEDINLSHGPESQVFGWSCAPHILKDFKRKLRNMAALNYILYVEFDGKFQYGPPVHSAYKRSLPVIAVPLRCARDWRLLASALRFENKRKDVWWVHK